MMASNAVNWEPILTCAVTGAGDTTSKHPDIPVTPEEIAESALSAARAGAAIVHLHVREPSTGRGSRDLSYYREVVERIRAAETDVILNLTTGMGGDLEVGANGAEDTPAPGSDLVSAMERLEHVEELRPDICSLDCGSMNFNDENLVYVMPASYLRESAKRLQELGVKPELEVFDLGHVEMAKKLIGEGLVDDPPLFQICLGLTYGAPATTEAMLALRSHLPERANWSGFAVGRMEMPMVAQAMVLGGNLRVGLEDNIYLERGVLASNESLVTRAKEIVERLGGRLAGVEEARERLFG